MSKPRIRNIAIAVNRRTRFATAFEKLLLTKPKKGAPVKGSDRYQPSFKKKTMRPPKETAPGHVVVEE